MTSAESDSLMAIWVVATIMILSCHCLQAMNNDLAWVFNVRVEMFFCCLAFDY